MFRLTHKVRTSLTNIASGGMNLLFPPVCAYCNADLPELEDNLLMCAECCGRLVPKKWIGCRHCGGTLPEELEFLDHCQLCKNPPRLFDTVVTLGGYHTDLREAILRMKHPRQAPLATAMGRLLARKRFHDLAELNADMIIPIPMYWSRRLKRGVNSPEILALCLGEKLGIPIQRRLLVRCKNTRPQVELLSPKHRFSNVRGAFKVRTPQRLQNTRVLLVDDVLTTGATCSEAAGMLIKAGASMVAVAVVARAQGFP